MQIGKIPEIIEGLVSTIFSVDCLSKLSAINCRKSQTTLLAKIKIVSVFSTRKCVDDLFIVQQEKRTARKEETRMIFIDLEKTHDSVARNRMWRIREEYIGMLNKFSLFFREN